MRQRGPGVAVGMAAVIIAGIMLGQTPPPTSEAPVNPEFTALIRDLELGIAKPLVTQDQRWLGHRPMRLDMWHLMGQAPVPPRAPFPASYDLRTYNKMTAVRAQGDCGSCWAFATYGSMESILRPAETRDFSENNLKNLHGFNWTPCFGGNGYLSMAYLARWAGPVNEADDPYQATNVNTSPPGLPPQKHTQEVWMLPMRATALDNDVIKDTVMTLGAVDATMTWVDASYNSVNAAYYYTGTSDTNHDVTIAGWDDNYSRYNFVPAASGNGAFLVKNSWGSGWGQSGYFWVSYYDSRFARTRPLFAFVDNEGTPNYSRQYSYDPLGWVSSLGMSNPTAHFANIFTAAATENIAAVSFYTTAANATYTIRVFTGVTAGVPTSGSLGNTTTGSATYAGYHTVALSSQVPVANGTRFSVAVQMTTPGYNYPIPIEYAVSGFSSAATASPGQSFYSSNGTSWTDLTAFNSTANASLKAFTKAQVVTTIRSVPAGLEVILDATHVTTEINVALIPGTSHTIATVSPQYDSATSRWVWSSWSDGGAMSHTITAPDVNTTYAATFHREFQLTMDASAGGSVSPSTGFYNAGQNVIIQANALPGYVFSGWTGAGSGSYTGTNNPATVTLNAAVTEKASFTPVPVFQPIRVNAGGPSYTSPSGVLWQADMGFQVGSSTYGVSHAIRNTADQCLYQCERWNAGPVSYSFAVPNGDYNVRLKFAEIYFTRAGQRSFHIDINGVRRHSGFDIVSMAGMANTAYDVVFPTTVNSGNIGIVLTPSVSNPKISAIEITQAGVAVTMQPTGVFLWPSGTKQFTSTVVGSGNTAVTWSLSPSVGTITTGGLYTAPGSITTETTVNVIATSQADSTKTATASVVLSPSWTTADIGPVNETGSAAVNAGRVFTLTGAGDVFGSWDALRYAAQTMTGDGAIVARVKSGATGYYTKAGVMMRGSFAPNAPHAFVSVFQGAVGLMEARSTTGGDTTYEFGSGGLFWVRLERRGNLFTGYVSNDGDSWAMVGTPKTIALPATIYAGLVVSSGYGPVATADFDNVSVTSSVSVSVNEKLSSLTTGETATFTAQVLGASSNSVTWSVLPAGMGSISAGGVYTAPASIATPTQVTIQATSVADPTKSGIALVNLGYFLPIRINAGGPSHIDPTGVFWNGDTNASAGSTFSNGTPVTGTATPYLYQTEHFNNGAFQYKFYVPPGTYFLKLKFAEIWYTSPGQRIFHVTVNGIPFLTNFDVVAQAGGAFLAVDRTMTLTTAGNQLVIAFTPVVSAPKVNAIEIHQ